MYSIHIISPARYHSVIINTCHESKLYRLNAQTTDTDTITVTHTDNPYYALHHVRNLFWDYTGYRYPMTID